MQFLDLQFFVSGVVDVMEGNTKLMLGLIWTLIRRYQIKSSGNAVSTKQAMLQWLETIIPEIKISNFATNWNNGIALCTLVDRLQPGLCPNHSVLDPSNGLDNCTLGMTLATDELGIPQILKPEHLNNPKVDEMSVMTYISYFCKPAISSLLAWVQSKIPHQNITNFTKDWSTGVNLAALLESVSPGIFPDWNQLDPHNAIANLEKAMTAAEQLGAQRVLSPKHFASPDVDEINIVTYISRIQKCGPVSLPNQCLVTGQGIVKAFVRREAHFEVDTSHAGIGKLEVTAVSSSGKDIPVKFAENRNNIFSVSYTALEPGQASISIKWGSNAVSNSPFKPSVIDPGTFKFYGPEITDGKLCKIGKPITMFAEGIADVGELEVTIKENKVTIQPKGSHEAQCTYVPRKAGIEQVVVKLAGKAVPQSPFEIIVVDPSSCKVISSDADPACIGKPFTIKAAANSVNARGIISTATSPSQNTSLTTDVQDANSVIIRYTPKELGAHSIDVTCEGEVIQGSPIPFEVIDTIKVIFKDPVPKSIQLGNSATVHFDTSNAGKAIFAASSSNPNVLVSVVETNGDHHLIELTPLSLGTCELTAMFGGYPLSGFPATVKVCDSTSCTAYGKGLVTKQGKVGELFEFTVQSGHAGDGELEVIPSGPNSRCAADIENMGNGKYNVSFTSYEPGLHSIEILWSGQPIPDSPIAVKFISSASGQFTASGEGLSKCTAKQTAKFMLLGPESGLLQDNGLSVSIEGNGHYNEVVPTISPINTNTDILICVDDLDNGKYQVQYCVPDGGDYDILIMCSGEHISGSPFNVYALPAPEPEKCRIFGPAIDQPHKLVVGKPIEFKVDSTDAGTGTLDVVALDPTMMAVPVYIGEQKGTRNERVHVVKVDPKHSGKHTFEVKWNGQHVSGSPLRLETGDPKMVKIISIPDKETYIPKIDEPFDIVVDDTNAGPGIVEVKFKLPNSSIIDVPAHVTKHKQKKFTFTPKEVGRIDLLLTFSDVNILEFHWFADVINAKSFEVISSVTYARQGDYVKYVVAGMKKSNSKNMVLKARNAEHNHDATVKVDMKKDGTAIGRFTAKHLGKYDVSIMCAKAHVSGSPFPVYIVNPDYAEFKKELPSTLVLGATYTVEIDCSNCGPGELQCSLKQEDESPCLDCTLDISSNGTYEVTVQPVYVGECELGFQWEDYLINEMQQISVIDIKKCRVVCPQLEGKRTVKQNEPVEVMIDVSGCGKCIPDIIAKGPQANYNVSLKEKSPGKFVTKFSPWQTGKHNVQISIGGKNVPSGPLMFLVLKDIKPEQITASGDGLKEAVTERNYDITIYGLESGLLERGQLTYNLYNIIGDFSAPPICHCVDNHNGLYTLSYTTYDDGDHCLDILYEGQHISLSPFKIYVKAQPRADQCIASGRSIQPDSFLSVKEQAEIIVDSRKAGVGVLKASGRQPDGSKIRVFVNYEEKDKLHYLLFDATKVGKYMISVEWDETAITGSPFAINVVDPSRCFITGDLPTSISVGVSRLVTVDTTGAGVGSLDILFVGSIGSSAVECTAQRKSDTQYELEFKGCSVGMANASLQWGGIDIPKSPFGIEVCDASNCVLEAGNVKNKNLRAGSPFTFKVMSSGAGKSKPIVRPSIGSEAQYIIDISSNEEGDEYTVVCTPQMIGCQTLDIIWVDNEIPGSPLSFSVFDPNKCQIIGLPDSSTFTPFIGEDIEFSVDQTEAGPGDVATLAHFSDGTEETLPVTKNDNISSFVCSPRIAGRFELVLLFNGVQLLKSPWISDIPDPLQFKVTPPKATGKVYEPVKFFITGITEQKQNFKVTAVHPDHPAFVTVESGKDRNTAVAVFTPEAVGEYLVHVKHAFQDIEGSPFVIDVVNPSVIDVLNPPPEQVPINEECVITMTTTNAGNGPLNCQFSALAGDMCFTSTEESIIGSSAEDVKEVRFKADKVGSAEVTLRWGDHIVSPSPYTVHFIDPSKVFIVCPELENKEAFNLGEPTDVIINCCEAGHGVPEVKVNNRSSDVDSTAITVNDKKDGTFIATITPWKSGEHELLVSFGGCPISDAPVEFEVKKIVDPRGITAVGEGTKTAVAKEPTLIVINASTPGLLEDGSLNVVCVCTDREAVDGEEDDTKIELTDMGDGTYNLGTVYPQIGNYILHIDYKDQPIYQSPFNVSVNAAPNAASCKIFGTAIEKMKKGQAFLVSQSIQFMIDTTLAGNGYLMCTVQDPCGDPVRVFSNDDESEGKRTAYLQFDPYDVGQYTVQVYWSSELIPETPLIFSIVDPTRCLVQGLPVPNNGAVQIGEEIEFAIAPGNCGIETPQVTLKTKEGEKQFDLTAEVTDSGVYKYNHLNEEAGNFNINVTVGGCHIPGSPYKCEVLDPNHFAIFGLNLKSDYAVVCELVSFKIQGNPPEGESFVITAHGPQADLSCDITVISESLTESSFVPIEPGSYEVFVECANTHVTGSPFTVNVADPSKCQLLEVPSQLQIGCNHEIIIKTRGAGMGVLTAQLEQKEDEENTVDISIEDQGLDTYCVFIEPHKVSDVQLQINWAGYPIPQSPLHLNICDANQCKVYGQAIMSKKGKVGEVISFTIVSNRAGISKPVVKANGPSAQYSITPREVGENKHEAQFTPWEVGEHTVEILWGNAKIPNSPFVIDVEKNVGGLPTCHATGEGLKKAITGKQAVFTLVSNEIGLLEKGVLKVSVAGVRGHAEVELTDTKDGCYQVKYLPPNPGAYIATVTYYERQIPGSPFKISCVPGPDATKCRVEGLHRNSLFLTGNPIEFTVNSSEAGYGQLKVFIQGPQDYRPRVYVADDGKGSHLVKFDAMQQGRYLIIVAWSEKHVPGSPFKVKVHPAPDASKVIVDGPGLQGGKLDGDTNFSINTKEAGIGTLLIRVHGIKDTFKIEANPLKPDDPRILIANYHPKVGGSYTIFIRWSGIHVPGSPFSVHIAGDEGAEVNINARKMIRGVRRQTDGAIVHRSRTGGSSGHRRTSRKDSSGASMQGKTRRISRKEVSIAETSRRISRQEAMEAAMGSEMVGNGPRRQSFFSSLFRSSTNPGMSRTRSGSELPRVGPVKPKMKMRKNPSMGQMPLYVPQSEY